jgi:hypothetical protein
MLVPATATAPHQARYMKQKYAAFSFWCTLNITSTCMHASELSTFPTDGVPLFLAMPAEL